MHHLNINVGGTPGVFASEKIIAHLSQTEELLQETTRLFVVAGCSGFLVIHDQIALVALHQSNCHPP